MSRPIMSHSESAGPAAFTKGDKHSVNLSLVEEATIYEGKLYEKVEWDGEHADEIDPFVEQEEVHYIIRLRFTSGRQSFYYLSGDFYVMVDSEYVPCVCDTGLHLKLYSQCFPWGETSPVSFYEEYLRGLEYQQSLKILEGGLKRNSNADIKLMRPGIWLAQYYHSDQAERVEKHLILAKWRWEGQQLENVKHYDSVTFLKD